MEDRTKIRIREIRKRTRRRRCQNEIRILSCLSVLTMLLIAGIRALLADVQTAGIVQVNSAYSSVLIRQETGGYILVGVAAFVVGAAVTVIFVRIRRKMKRRE